MNMGNIKIEICGDVYLIVDSFRLGGQTKEQHIIKIDKIVDAVQYAQTYMKLLKNDERADKTCKER